MRLMPITASSNSRCPWRALAFSNRWKQRNPPTGTTPESECSLRRRNGRRLLAKSDCAEEVSDTLDLGPDGGAGDGDVWDGEGDVKVMPEPRTMGPARFAGLLVLALAAGCAGSGRGEPTAALSSSVQVEGDFRKLEG